MGRRPLTIKLSPRLFSDGEKCFGPGIATLLEGVDRQGSLSAAASGIGMAYSKAWTSLRQCEEFLDLPLLDRQAGGRKGGRSRLTPGGRALLEGYRSMERHLVQVGESLLHDFNETWTQPGQRRSTVETGLKRIEEHLETGRDLALATVTARSGSAPRGAGARMLVGQQGRLWGTVGGGLIERRTEELCATALIEKRGCLQEFCLDAEGAAPIGMVCGGDVTMMVQYLPAGSAQILGVVRQVLEMGRNGGDGWLLSCLDSGGQTAMELLTLQEGAERHSPLGRKHTKAFFEAAGGHCFAQRLAPGGMVYVFGGGHVAREVSPLLTQMDFPHVVMDDRAEFSCTVDFPGAAQVICADFTQILDHIFPRATDYAVVMTRGHSFDLEVQRQLLSTPVGYIGVMGSRKKRDFVFGELRKSGFTDADLGRIVTPIGLPLGGETPAEIALSVAAELVQRRAKRGV